MRIASVYHAPATSFFMGVASARDPGNPAQAIVLASDGAAGKVRIFNLDSAGTLSEVTAIALSADPARRAFPAQIAVTPDNRTAYVADNLGNSVIAIDIDFARRAALGSGRGFSALRCRRKVQRRGLRHGSCCLRTGRPAALRPQFVAPTFDPSKSSALSVLQVAGGSAGDPTTVPMDAAPDGSKIVGGAAPGAAVISRDGSLAYVAHGERRSHLRSLRWPERRASCAASICASIPGAPYGAQPSAEALSPDGKRLYVALAGLNSVAVLDARSRRAIATVSFPRDGIRRRSRSRATGATSSSPAAKASTAGACCSVSISSTRR